MRSDYVAATLLPGGQKEVGIGDSIEDGQPCLVAEGVGVRRQPSTSQSGVLQAT